MIFTTATFKDLMWQRGSWYEVNVVVETGGTPLVYGLDKLKTCKLTQSLFTKKPPTVGGAVAAQCNLTLLEEKENWPRGGAFSVRIRAWNESETRHSEWITLGQFYTDQRIQHGSTLEVFGLDAMVRTEQSWTDKIPQGRFPSEWPITAKAAVDLICEALNIPLDSRTVLDNTVKFVGLKSVISEQEETTALDEGFTARDTLASVASAMGGNFRITNEGKLLLVPLKHADIDIGSAAIPGIAVAGITIVGDSDIETGSAAIPGIAMTGINVVGDDVVSRIGSMAARYDYTYVGPGKFQNIETGAPLPQMRGVELTAPDGTVASSGTDYMLKGICDFSDSTSVADLALSKVSGYVYRPFTVTRCVLDPSVEIGDVCLIGKTTYPIISATWTLGKHIFCTFEAPFESEQEHEYMPQSDMEKAMIQSERVELGLKSVIRQTAGEILLEVSRTYATQSTVSTLSSRVTVNADKISLVVSETQGGYVVNSAEIVASINDAGSSVRIKADKIQMTGTTTFLTPGDVGNGGSTVISGNRITTGTIDASDVNIVNLNASNITVGTMSASRIYGGTLDAGNMTVTNLTVTGTMIAPNTITGWNIQDGTITMDKLNVGSLTAGSLEGNTIEIKDVYGYTTGNINPAYYNPESSYSSASLRIGTNIGSHLYLNPFGNLVLVASAVSGADIQISPEIVPMHYIQTYTQSEVVSSVNIGSPYYKFEDIYAWNGTIQTSDRTEKKEISYDLTRYDALFDALKPCSYQFKNGHGRTHTGLIAQDIEEELQALDIPSTDFAAFIKNVKNEKESYGLRYEEFIAMLIRQVQQLKSRVSVLEGGEA